MAKLTPKDYDRSEGRVGIKITKKPGDNKPKPKKTPKKTK
jgi:hypothetical protein